VGYVAADLSTAEGAATVARWVLDRWGGATDLPRMSKLEVAVAAVQSRMRAGPHLFVYCPGRIGVQRLRLPVIGADP